MCSMKLGLAVEAHLYANQLLISHIPGSTAQRFHCACGNEFRAGLGVHRIQKHRVQDSPELRNTHHSLQGRLRTEVGRDTELNAFSVYTKTQIRAVI